ncbi:MAG: IS5 family transposase [Candidatus Latescibacteria bacterium]|jgi:IS5 family transposase|nr:IS5 family transposase [Candidatus Latescibacterota bacterium]
MERKGTQPTFMDGYVADLGDPKMAAKLDQLDRTIPWQKLASPIRATYDNDGEQGGRPNVAVVVMLKIVMLQKWFSLSDEALEGMLLDRISFRRFVGLSMHDGTVDATTLVKFRNRLREQGLMSVLFDMVVAHLRDAGLVVQEGTLVDATIIEAPRGRTTDDGLGHTKDQVASYTKKHGKTYHGYKAHVATDANGIITNYVYDTAKVHDSQHIDQLIEGEDQAVFADSAYMNKDRKARLQQKGVFCGIIERRVRGQAELTAEQKTHNRLCASFRAYVEYPFAWIKNTGELLRTRYRGLARNAIDFALNAMAYNFKRSLSLMT